MAEVLMFHHALGLTDGVRAFADHIRSAGHAVTAPDLYDGRVFSSLADGVAYAEQAGMEHLAARGAELARKMPDQFVVAGFSLGVLPAQKAAQTLGNVTGAILYHSAVHATVFGDSWPKGVWLQIHLNDNDELAAEDRDAANALASETGAELFIYSSRGHLVAEPDAPDYDPEIAESMLERSLAFLRRCDDSRGVSS